MQHSAKQMGALISQMKLHMQHTRSQLTRCRAKHLQMRHGFRRHDSPGQGCRPIQQAYLAWGSINLLQHGPRPGPSPALPCTPSEAVHGNSTHSTPWKSWELFGDSAGAESAVMEACSGYSSHAATATCSMQAHTQAHLLLLQSTCRGASQP